MSFSQVLEHAFEAYSRNIKLISFFSIPFLIVFPLSLLLPNFTALSGIFLRFASIRYDLTSIESITIGAVFLVSLLLSSFALSAINVVIKSQRTLLKLSHQDVERVESGTYRLFTIFLLAFVFLLVTNLLLFNYLSPAVFRIISPLLALTVSLAVVFAPQAIAVDDLGLMHAVRMSLNIVYRKLAFFLIFLVIAAFLILADTYFFNLFRDSFPLSYYIGIAVNALVVVPFLEVLKTQVYLSKYTLL